MNGAADSLEMTVDGHRMIKDLRELDRLTGGDSGVRRLAWTTGWDRAREWLAGKLDEIGVRHDVDGAGNLWAELPDSAPAPVIATGSHLDAVPAGGWLDGALGTVAALELLRAARESGWNRATLRLVDWADEEGARFGSSTFGSSAAAGLIDLDEVLALRDADRDRLGDVLADRGITPATIRSAGNRLSDLDFLLELHIEQGPVLERGGAALGVPEGAAAVRRLSVMFRGSGGHAGTVPMEERNEAIVAGARLIAAVPQIAREGKGLATCGTVAVQPNVANAIAEEMVVSIDLRAPDDVTVEELTESVRTLADNIAAEAGVMIEAREIWSFPAVRFDRDLRNLLDQVVSRLAPGSPKVMAGALHDAVAMARAGKRTSMLFVRSIGGVSHHRDEDTSEDDLDLAVHALAASVDALAS